MARRSILARYDAAATLEQRVIELDPTAVAGAHLSPIHLRAVEVLTDLLSMADQASDEETPQILRTLLTIVRRSRGMLLDLIGKVPEAAIVAMMSKLRDDLQSVIDAGSAEQLEPAEAPAAEVYGSTSVHTGTPRREWVNADGTVQTVPPATAEAVAAVDQEEESAAAGVAE